MKIKKKDLVANGIMSWIAEAHYKPGSKIPPECALTEKFGVSRIVVRAAIGNLVEQGVLLRRQGAGTYVAGDFQHGTGDTQIAALMPIQDSLSSAYNLILEGIEMEAAASGRTLVLCNHRNSAETALECMARIGRLGIKGILYVPMELHDYEHENSNVLRAATKLGLTVTLVDKLVRGGASHSPSFVGGNGYDGIREAVAHLAGLGHRRIGAIMSRPGFGAEMRINGFIDALDEHGIELDRELLRIEEEAVPPAEEGRTAARRILGLRNPPTAIVCQHDWIARNLYEEATALGVSIPGDLSITGFDDLPFAAELRPALTTVRQPFELIGRTAVKMTLRKLYGAKESSSITEHLFLPVALIARGSTAAS